MIFKQIDEVLSGRKTQTRRLVKAGDFQTPSGNIVYGESGKTTLIPRFVVGKRYAVQPGRAKRGVGHIRITEIRLEYVYQITEDDAIAEGVNSVEEYRQLWDSIYEGQPEKQWGANPEVWVVTFEAVK